MGKKRKIKAEPRLDEGLFCAAAGGFGFVTAILLALTGLPEAEEK